MCVNYMFIFSGKKSGLAALLRGTRSHLVSRNLELSFKDTIKSNKQYDKAMTCIGNHQS